MLKLDFKKNISKIETIKSRNLVRFYLTSKYCWHQNLVLTWVSHITPNNTLGGIRSHPLHPLMTWAPHRVYSHLVSKRPNLTTWALSRGELQLWKYAKISRSTTTSLIRESYLMQLLELPLVAGRPCNFFPCSETHFICFQKKNTGIKFAQLWSPQLDLQHIKFWSH